MGEDPSPQLDSLPPPARPADEGSQGFDRLLSTFERLSQIPVVLAGSLTAAGASFAAVKLYFQQPFAFVPAMLLLFIVGISAIVLARHIFPRDPWRARLLRIGGCAAVVVVLLSSAMVVSLAIMTRDTDGPIIAIAQFKGPKLPAPYDDCRPSDMLTDTLTDVAERYSHLKAFELPYVIDPNGRWAEKWASWYALFEGADTIVYGEYSFVDNSDGERNNPDRLLISPAADQVTAPWPFGPLWNRIAHRSSPIPLGPKTAPLLAWRFPERTVPIDELCTGTARRFLDDGRRLALAFVGLQAFAKHEYVAAESALCEGEHDECVEKQRSQPLSITPATPDDARCDDVSADSKSNCSGVLAFYLAALQQRLGHYEVAEREYRFAGKQLVHQSAPYTDLAELYVLQNKPHQALEALESAEDAEPQSLVAAASLARYENEFGHSAEALVDRMRASDPDETSERSSEYAQISYCRMLYELRGHQAEGLACRDGVSQSAYGGSPDALVEYGRWLIEASRHDAPNSKSSSEHLARGIAKLEAALKGNPSSIAANYQLALALSQASQKTASDKLFIRELYRRALDARAFTDEQYTDQGNAAADLGELDRAQRRYHEALRVNQNYAYAHENRGKLYWRRGDMKSALADLEKAAQLHPVDCRLRDVLVTLSSEFKRT